MSVAEQYVLLELCHAIAARGGKHGKNVALDSKGHFQVPRDVGQFQGNALESSPVSKELGHSLGFQG